MADTLFLNQMAVAAIIGVFPEEQQTPQTIMLDLEWTIDVHSVAAKDDLKDTVDYAAVYHDLQTYIPNTRFQLLETLAVQISERLFEKFPITWLRLKITKKPSDLPNIAGAGIMIERDRP